MMDLSKVWNFDFMWDAFAYFLKIVAPFLMLIIALLGVGILLVIVVNAIVVAVRNR